MLASSEDAVLRAEQSLASAGITDGAILPGVYEGSGEGSKLVADGTRLDKETVKHPSASSWLRMGRSSTLRRSMKNHGK
jgi:hypothetical protein